MKVIETRLKDCMIIQPNVFGDDRGFFIETFQTERYREMAGINHDFVQIIIQDLQSPFYVASIFRKISHKEN